MQGAHQAAHRHQLVVDAEQHVGIVLARTQVDVGGAAGNRIRNQAVHQPHDRLLACQPVGLGLALDADRMRIEAELAHGFAVFGQVVAVGDGLADAARAGHHRQHVVGGGELQRGQRLLAGGVFHRRGQQAVVQAQRHHP